MSATHIYTLLDKSAAERVCRLHWRKAIQNVRSRWFTSRVFERGGYDFNHGTLRGLIAFSFDPEPTDDEIEQILDSDTIAATMSRCHPQFWTIEEVLRRLNPGQKQTIDVELRDLSCLASVMIRAFVERRITASQMWSVVKLHNLDVTSYVADQALNQRVEGFPWSSLWRPMFSWQDEDACRGDESTNCLSAVQTRQFCALVERAYREDWKTLETEEHSLQPKTDSFKRHAETVSFAR